MSAFGGVKLSYHARYRRTLVRAGIERGGVRLRHRRRRLGRLRARRPADRGRPAHACCCSSTAARTARSSSRCRRRCPIPMNMARYDWRYETEPEPHLGGRRLHTPRGKVLGGSSSINGMVYIRGNALRLRPLGGGGRARLGLSPTCCPTSGAPRRARRAATPIAAATGRCRRRYGTLANPLYRAFIEAGARRPAIPRPTTSTASSRKASAGWT